MERGEGERKIWGRDWRKSSSLARVSKEESEILILFFARLLSLSLSPHTHSFSDISTTPCTLMGKKRRGGGERRG